MVAGAIAIVAVIESMTTMIRAALNRMVALACRTGVGRSALHGVARRITGDLTRSDLARGRAYNLLAAATAPSGFLTTTIPIPELPHRPLTVRLDLNDELSRAWYYCGYDKYEPEVRKVLWHLIKNEKSDAFSVLDIGANLGYFSLYLGSALAERGSGRGRVYAFEPSPDVIARLERNLQLNPQLPVTIVEGAVDEKDGHANLFLAGADWGHSSASLIEGAVDQVGAVKVRTYSIDSYAEQENLPPVRLVKMDCEGAEAAALRGMVAVIARDKPHIVLELLPRFDNVTQGILAHSCFDGYRKFLITAQGLVEHTVFATNYENRDWLVTTDPPTSLIRAA
jgi:FkbM family methyltransferase